MPLASGPAAGADTAALADCRELAALLPEPHWLVTTAGEIVFANPAAAALLGCATSELSARSLSDLATDAAAKLERYLTMCTRSREMVPGALTLRGADGAPIPCRCDGAVLRPRDGDTPALLLLRTRPKESAASRFIAFTERVDALNHEIARRQEAERTLRRQAELLERTHDAILVWELGGGITYLNRAAELLYGYPRADVIGRRTHALLRTQAATPIAEIEDLLRTTGEWNGELVHTTRDGRELAVESRMVLLRDEIDGGTPLVLETVRDMTETRRARAQLESTHRLEAVGRLAGGVAHEINNALQGALGFSTLALRRMSAQDPARADVQQALRAGERAAAITQGLLAFSRRQVLQPSDVSLVSVVEEFASMLRQALGPDRELALVLPQRPVVVYADRGRLEQVLLNFVLNARDAVGPGGRVTIRVGSAELAGSNLRRLGRPDLPAGSYAVLEVADNGHGMDAATKARVFEPFYTTKAPGQGTGLGLAVVHGIVHQSGGAIQVQSAPGQGSTFTVYLSESRADARDDARAVVRARGGGERILVVDDEPLVVELVSRALADEGYTVLRASDGVEALRCLDEPDMQGRGAGAAPVDLVLTDIVMPRLDGRELGDALACRYPNLPILYTSGHPGEEMVRQGRLVDGAAFIQKPFPPEQLLLRVRELLDRVE